MDLHAHCVGSKDGIGQFGKSKKSPFGPKTNKPSVVPVSLQINVSPTLVDDVLAAPWKRRKLFLLNHLMTFCAGPSNLVAPQFSVIAKVNGKVLISSCTPLITIALLQSGNRECG